MWRDVSSSRAGGKALAGEGDDHCCYSSCHEGSVVMKEVREERDANTRQRIVGPRADSVMVPQRRDFRGVIDPLLSWKETLVVKGDKEVENAEANSKYRDRVEGQRPRNFIRPVSTGFSSR
ncbi:hypothetical protein BHE74_00000262 [Ensete ventricosum]|nr:hypothetical protein GW17_00028661 [Ensete ventricosum]RWW90689.1 hypothetical protein BHE74_00000262 [Ensete ventricosum]